MGDKIVVAGYSDGDFAFARLNKDGSLDTSFDTDGKQTVDFGAIDSANAVEVAGDRIVAAGYTGYPNADFAVTRLTKSGSLDASFDGDGRQTTDFAGGPDAGHALDVKGDRILVVGEATPADHSVLAAVMYTKDGGYDAKFSGDGKTTMDVGTDARGYGGAFGPGETVVAAGMTCFSCYPGNRFVVARWTKDGAPDTGFGTTGPGYTQTDVGGTDDSGASALVLGPEDKIVAAGYSGDQFAIARYVGKK
jgi:uncharacterized delta-60 repeat protein